MTPVSRRRLCVAFHLLGYVREERSFVYLAVLYFWKIINPWGENVLSVAVEDCVVDLLIYVRHSEHALMNAGLNGLVQHLQARVYDFPHPCVILDVYELRDEQRNLFDEVPGHVADRTNCEWGFF